MTQSGRQPPRGLLKTGHWRGFTGADRPTGAVDPKPPLSLLRTGHSCTRMRTVASGIIRRGVLSGVSVVRTDVNCGVSV
jgi:hypothetical protein